MFIDDKYLINNDENNFRLAEIKVRGSEAKNPGEERLVVQGYYGDLSSALKGYLKYSLRNDFPEDVSEIYSKLQEIEKNIEIFCKKIAVHKGVDINLERVEPDRILIGNEVTDDITDDTTISE